MEAPIYVRALTEAERQHIQNALRSSDAFTLRRAQIIRASADRQTAKPIAKAVGCSVQSARNAIRAFNQTGVDCLKKQSSCPKTAQSVFDEAKQARLQHLLHQSPRVFGHEKSVWTLPLLVTVCQQEGLTEQTVSDETVRRALKRFGWNWKRAKMWINSPDPAYDRKKTTRLADCPLSKPSRLGAGFSG